MKKVTSLLLVVLTAILVIPAFTVSVGASSAYQTYTYSIDGKALYSPDAYTAVKVVSAADMGLPLVGDETVSKLENPSDLITDSEGNCYIADTGHSRIIKLSRYYEYVDSISTFANGYGIQDSLNEPQGVFAYDDVNDPDNKHPHQLWVCDTNNNRLVVFDRDDLSFIKIVDQPESQLFDDNAVYKPVAMAIDQYGRIYVVSSTTYQGVIVMDPDGKFVGFIGAQAVTISAWDIVWRRFQTDEQKKLTAKLISTEYNNITINDEGFVYVTTSSIDESSLLFPLMALRTDDSSMELVVT